MNILRFYGSCGHIEDNLISEEEMDNWKKPIIVKSIFGDNTHINGVTIEDGNQIVHVHPFRYCCCYKCTIKDMKEFDQKTP